MQVRGNMLFILLSPCPFINKKNLSHVINYTCFSRGKGISVVSAGIIRAHYFDSACLKYKIIARQGVNRLQKEMRQWNSGTKHCLRITQPGTMTNLLPGGPLENAISWRRIFPSHGDDDMNYAILKNVTRSLRENGKFIFTSLNGLFPLFHFAEKRKADEKLFSGKHVWPHDFPGYQECPIEDDPGNMRELLCSGRYYVPGKITRLLKPPIPEHRHTRGRTGFIFKEW